MWNAFIICSVTVQKKKERMNKVLVGINTTYGKISGCMWSEKLAKFPVSKTATIP